MSFYLYSVVVVARDLKISVPYTSVMWRGWFDIILNCWRMLPTYLKDTFTPELFFFSN